MNEPDLKILKKTKTWGVYEFGKNVHVAPAWQADDHNLKGDRVCCICNPVVEERPEGTMFIHRVIHEA
jgi:hypothetical protein